VVACVNGQSDGLPDSVAATQQLCLRASTQLSPDNLKAWFRYGRWCNRRAAAIMRRVNMPTQRHHRTKSTKLTRRTTRHTTATPASVGGLVVHTSNGATGTARSDTQSVRGDSGASGSRRNSADGTTTPHASPPRHGVVPTGGADDDHDKHTHGTGTGTAHTHEHDWESKGEASYLDEEKAMEKGYGPDDALSHVDGDGDARSGVDTHHHEGDDHHDDEGDDLDSKDSKEAEDHVSTPGDSDTTGTDDDDDGEEEGDEKEEEGGQDGDLLEQAGANVAEDEVVDDDDKDDDKDDDEFNDDDQNDHHHHVPPPTVDDTNKVSSGNNVDGKTPVSRVPNIGDTNDINRSDGRGRAPTRIDGDALRLVRLLMPYHQSSASLSTSSAGSKSSDITGTPTRSSSSAAGVRRTGAGTNTTPIPIHSSLATTTATTPSSTSVSISSYHSLVGPSIHGIANPNDIEMEVAHSSLLRSIHAMLVMSVNATLARRNYHATSSSAPSEAEDITVAALVPLSPEGLPMVSSIIDLLRPMIADGLRKLSDSTPSSSFLASPSFISTILDLGVQRAERLIAYHRLSARCYFRVLTIQFGSQASAAVQTDSRDTTHNRDYALSVPLLVLRLLTEYGTDLADVLSDGLASTPPLSWLQVVPLLFARLCHPNPVVRDQLCLLLARIGQRYPHVIVFRLIVDRHAAIAAGHTLKAEQLSCIAARIDTGRADVIPSASPSLSLTGSFGRLMDEVGKVITELNRVALLWEDTWLAKVRAIQAELPARIKLLADEIELINQSSKQPSSTNVGSPLMTSRSLNDISNINNNSASSGTNGDDESREARLMRIRKRYQVIMEPIVVQLTDLRAQTIDTTAETPHEEHFQRRYGGLLGQLHTALTSPSHPEIPSSVFRTIDALLSDLKRSFLRLSLLELRDISPFLHRAASQRPLSVPLAGLGDEMSSGDQPLDFFTGTFAPEPVQPPPSSSFTRSPSSSSANVPSVPAEVCLHSFSPSIEILRTKTRPKKLVVLGWDGRYYRYLLKAREDLHLDERMMHFLQAVNRSLARDHTTKRTDYLSVPGRPLLARTYPVVPLSDKAGLIRWVDNVTPLFDVYRKWASRAQAVPPQTVPPQQANVPNTNAPAAPQMPPPPPPQVNVAVAAALKPTELYAQKIRDYLMERGLSPNTPRAQWPREVLLRVFYELAQATPKELLARELWCTSPSPAEWWRKTGAFTSSVAVMSMIGYMVGLGDRHLGNMMADFATGQIVHIDYNICFDRGRKLPIPELVPFRLTPIMEEAFGMTGVRGAFANSCQQVMAVMRRNAQTLVSLLDTFIYDPIVDWVPADRKPESRRRRALDHRMALTLSSWRIDKNNDILHRVHTSLESVLPSVDNAIASLQTLSHQLSMVNDDAIAVKLPSATWLADHAQSLMIHARNDSRHYNDTLRTLRDRLTYLSSQLHDTAVSGRRDSEQKLDAAIQAITLVCDRHHVAMTELAGDLVPSVYHKFAANASTTSTTGSDQFSEAYFHLRNLAAPLTSNVSMTSSMVTTLQRNCALRDVAMGKTLKMLKMALHRMVKVLMLYRTLVSAATPSSTGDITQYTHETISWQWLPLLTRARATTSSQLLQSILDDMTIWRQRAQRVAVYNDTDFNALISVWNSKRTLYQSAQAEVDTLMITPFQLAMTTASSDTLPSLPSSSSQPLTGPIALHSYLSADQNARGHVSSLIDSLIANSSREIQAHVRANQLIAAAKRTSGGKAIAAKIPSPSEPPVSYGVDIICNLAWLQIVMDLADQVIDIQTECATDYQKVLVHVASVTAAAGQASLSRSTSTTRHKLEGKTQRTAFSKYHQSSSSSSSGHRVVKGIRRKPTGDSKVEANSRVVASDDNQQAVADNMSDDESVTPSPLARLDVLLSTMVAVGNICHIKLCTSPSSQGDSIRLHNNGLVNDCIGVIHHALQLPADFSSVVPELAVTMLQLLQSPSISTDESSTSGTGIMDSKRLSDMYDTLDSIGVLSNRIRVLLDEMDQLIADDNESAIASAAAIDSDPLPSVAAATTPSKGKGRGSGAATPSSASIAAGGSSATATSTRSTFSAVLQRRQRDAERAKRRAELSVELRTLHMAYRRIVDAPVATPNITKSTRDDSVNELMETKSASTNTMTPTISSWLTRVDGIVNTLDQSTVSFRASLIRNGIEAPAMGIAGMAASVTPFSSSDILHLRVFLAHRLQLIYDTMAATLLHVTNNSNGNISDELSNASIYRTLAGYIQQFVTSYTSVQVCPMIQSVLCTIVDQQLQAGGSPATGRLPCHMYLPRHRPGMPLPSLVQVPLYNISTSSTWSIRRQLLNQIKALHVDREALMNDVWRLLRTHFSLNAQLQFAQRAFNKRLTIVQAKGNISI
jgi:hypothetical protein